MELRAEAVERPQVTTIREAWNIFVDVLNGPAHERALYLYMVLVLAHWAEHLFQAYQIFVLHWPRPEALGLLGLWLPWLVQTETLHWGYAFFMLLGLFLLRPGFQGRSRLFWNISLVIQIWHFIEHTLLQGQAIVGQYLFGSKVPISIVQLWVPRPELHLIYNGLVFIPMVIAMYYHLYPPQSEAPVACTCSRRSPLHAKQAKPA
ncbi:MAG: hypothetical protein WAM60_19945 [Candidatus Promineifilaceae bacterium]